MFKKSFSESVFCAYSSIFFSVSYESPPMAASLFWYAEMIEWEPSPGQSVSKHTACIVYVCSTRFSFML